FSIHILLLSFGVLSACIASRQGGRGAACMLQRREGRGEATLALECGTVQFPSCVSFPAAGEAADECAPCSPPPRSSADDAAPRLDSDDDASRTRMHVTEMQSC